MPNHDGTPFSDQSAGTYHKEIRGNNGNVRIVDFGDKFHLGGLEWVGLGNHDVLHFSIDAECRRGWDRRQVDNR